MTSPAGKRVAPRAPGNRAPRVPRRALGLFAGALVGGGLWAGLVYLAVGYGQQVRNGQASSWPLLVLTGLSAMACLFLTFLAVASTWRALVSAPETEGPPRPVGGRRAKR